MGDLTADVPAHRLLRENTRDAHDDAEATTGMRQLLSGALDTVGYRTLLMAQLRLFEAWEAERAAELASIHTIWPYRSRATLLAADVAARPARDNAPSPHEAHVGARLAGDRAQGALLQNATPAFWGELYVIEGSALGGRVIVRQLRQLFPSLSHTYYAMGESAPDAWRHFQHALDTALPDEASQQRAIDGARRMFARFQQTLENPAHHV